MKRKLAIAVHCVLGVSIAALAGAAPAQAQGDTDLVARARVFPAIGMGAVALARDVSGRIYVLTSHPGVVHVFDAKGQAAGQIPAAPSKENSIVFGVDVDVDAQGRVYVADRATDTVFVFAPDGGLERRIHIRGPMAVASLPAGEVAVASASSQKLVTVFDARGKIVREFGDLADAASSLELNRFVNVGRLARDASAHLYYSFTYLPEPTVRRYDRFGFADLEFSLTTLDYIAVARATRREIERLERGGKPHLKPVVRAVAVDPVTGEIWLGLGGHLLRFAPDGTQRGSYLPFTPEGGRLEPNAILIEPGRILVLSETLGIYELPRPGISGLP